MIILPEIFVFIFGLIIGSFLNCLLWRLHENETIAGRSYCPKCRQNIAWYDNIPVLSFIALGGRCRHCRNKISWQYPLVELVTAFLFFLSFRLGFGQPQFSLLLARDWILISTLIIIFVYDFRWQLVPMNLVWPLTAVIFILNFLLGVSWISLLIFAASGAAFFLIQYFLTKKRGIGEGDIWLGLFLGAAYPSAGQLLLILILAYGVGALSALILLAGRKKGWKSRIALGPFLALGAIIALIWGERLITWYLGLV
jgi:prepilin signal peptidase PulO-like enzyme (type II secretory pathway)